MRVPEKPKSLTNILEKRGNVAFKLLGNKKIRDLVNRYNQDYIHWDNLRRKEMPKGISKEDIWLLMKISRLQQYKYLKFNDWDFQYALLSDAQRKLHLLDKGAAGHLETGIESIDVNGKTRYIISSLMEEAIASSQLEGAATTRKIAKEILRLRKKPRNKSEQMIVNGYDTMQKIAKMNNPRMTPEMILELHRSITQDTLKNSEDEGKFRDSNEITVGDPLRIDRIYHVPPDYKKIPHLMKEFCEFASSDVDEFVHPIIKGIILHFLIGYIHPFNDGNGRTARTIFYWYVLTRGYWLFEYMAISRILLRSRTKYGLAYLYSETDDNDLTYFIIHNLNAIEEALSDMESYISRKQREQQEAMKLIQGIREINLRQAEILKDFMKYPEKRLVINEIMSRYNVAYDTARNDLLYLTKLGHLEKIKVKNKFVFKLLKKE